MKRLLLTALVTAIAVAKPDMYKEKEDFQYSRSSSDEGSKSGYYGAQRGNMGGNYERAHNMDTLAQHQMSGLVTQVDGELGDGAKTRTGSVYSAANSRGIYGSGNYDLSNLRGRNFQEGYNSGDTQSHYSSMSQSGSNSHAASDTSAAYSSSQSHNSRQHSGYSGYQSTGYSDQNSQRRISETSDSLQTAQNYDHGGQSNLGYYSNSRYNAANGYTQSSSNLMNSDFESNGQTRVASGMPVRVVLRPGSTIPVSFPVSYDSNYRDSLRDQNSIRNYDILNNNNQQTNNPSSNNAKHYESSYQYRKQWEKHDMIPAVVSTVSPNTKHNEDTEQSENLQTNYRDSSYDQNSIMNYENLNNYQQQTNVPLSNNPKHYESSYKYRKEWEKHGAAPVLQIASSISKNSENKRLSEDRQGLTSSVDYDASRLNAQSSNYKNAYNGYDSRVQSNYNSQHENSYSGSDIYGHQAHTDASALNLKNQVEDLNAKPKSYQASYSYHKAWERQGDPYVIVPVQNSENSQTSQRLTTGSTSQSGAHSYNRQASTKSHQNYFNSENADCDENGHIRKVRSYRDEQFLVANEEQQGQMLEDLGQKPQTQWYLEDLGQQTQNKWDDLEKLGQQTQNLEDLGQQTQNLEDLGQQTQNLEDFGQQTQNLEDLGQQTQNLEDLSQHTQNLEDLSQHTQSEWNREAAEQQNQGAWNNFEQSQQNELNLGQQTQDTWTMKNEPQTNEHEPVIPPHLFKEHENNPNFDMQENHGTHSGGLQHVHYVPTLWNNFEIPYSQHINKYHTYINTQQYAYPNIFPQHHEDEFYTKFKNYQYEHNQQHNYQESHTSHKYNWDSWNSNTNQHHLYTTNHDSSNEGSSLLKGLWDKIDNIENQSSTNVNKDFNYNTNNNKENTFQNNSLTQNINNTSKDDIIDVNESSINNGGLSKDITSFVSSNNNNQDKAESLDVGRGDIGPDDLNNPEDAEISTTPSTMTLLIKEIFNIKYNSQNKTFYEPKENKEKIDNSFSDIPVIIEDAKKQERVLTDVNKQNRRIDNQILQNNSEYVNLEQHNVKPQESFVQQNADNLKHFGQQSENFDQQNVNLMQPFDQQNGSNLEQFDQQSDNFDQQNVKPFQSFDQPGIDKLENFDQQNVSPLETFDQKNVGNLEQSEKQGDKFDQQNVYPVDSFDQQNVGNLQHFDQQSDNFDQQNVSPLESFNQKNVGNLEQFEQQGDKFDQQNVYPVESFDQQNVGNLQQFDQQSDNFDQQNVKPLEPFDQQNGDKLGNFEQQNVSPLVSFDQQNVDNIGQIEQGDNFDLQNIQPLESFDQQNVDNLEQLEQQSDDFGQQNVKPVEPFDQQNIKPLESFDQENGDQLQQFHQQTSNIDLPNFRPLESFHNDQHSDKFEEHNFNPLNHKTNDDLVVLNNRPAIFEPTNVNENKFNSGDQQQMAILSEQPDDLVIPLQPKQFMIPTEIKSEPNVQSNVNLPDGTQTAPTDNFAIPAQQNSDNKDSIVTDIQSTSTETIPDPVTHKPGFWKSVGNKFTSAKDKITSWFSSS